MGKRRALITISLLLIGLFLAVPARAKTGDIDHLLITGPDGRQLEILGTMLNGQLDSQEQTDVYWPLLFGQNKGNIAPEGDLGPGYDITYVLRDVRDDPVKVSETVYLEAVPPAAFARKGQTHELYPGDVRKVPWGWRPFPEAAVPAIFSLMEEAERELPPAEPYPLPFDPFLMTMFAVPVVIVVGGLWFLVRRRRAAA